MTHRISAAKLIELLQALPDGSSVEPNAVRNLAVFNDSGEQIGYIDMLAVDQHFEAYKSV